jgi:hypothetical protein
MLLWKINKCYIFWCLSERSRVFLSVGSKARERACAHVALLIQHATLRHFAICDLSGLKIFGTFSHKRHDLRKKVTVHKMFILIFSTIFIWNISHFRKNSSRYCHKCENVFMWSTCYCCRILVKLEFPRQIFEKKNSNIKFNQNPSSGSRVGPCC